MSVRRAARLLALAAIALAVPSAALWAQGPLGLGVYQPNLAPLTFSRTQLEIGDRWMEQERCTECHGPFLRGVVAEAPGQPAGPPLRGPEFEEKWFRGNVGALFTFVLGHAAMQETYIATLMAQILARNGFQAGDVNLPFDNPGALRGMGFYQ